jgi:hypothetical protein
MLVAYVATNVATTGGVLAMTRWNVPVFSNDLIYSRGKNGILLDLGRRSIPGGDNGRRGGHFRWHGCGV